MRLLLDVKGCGQSPGQEGMGHPLGSQLSLFFPSGRSRALETRKGTLWAPHLHRGPAMYVPKPTPSSVVVGRGLWTQTLCVVRDGY